MLITFFVGNGFDISAGIDTSYASFYKWYCEQPSDTFVVDLLKREIREDMRAGGENWSDFELGLGKYTSRFSEEDIEQFLQCYDDAHAHIIKYLEQETQKFHDVILDFEAKRLRSNLANFYQELPPKERQPFDAVFKSEENNHVEIQFVSFNYTDILDKCVSLLSETTLREWLCDGKRCLFYVKPEVIHIHGTLNEFPILGVNDRFQISNYSFLSEPDFVNAMIKADSVEAVGQLWHEDTIKAIEDSKIICILGMSLGESDAMWWEKIMNWLRDSPDRHLLIFWHTKTPNIKQSIRKHTNEVRKVKNIILEYAPSVDTKAIEERIHVVINTNKILKINIEPDFVAGADPITAV